MRSSSIPRSLILLASAALSFGACAETAEPGTANNSSTGGTPSNVAGAPTAPSTAGRPAGGIAGSGVQPAGGSGSIATGTGGAGTGAVTAGAAAGGAGAPATGGAGATAGTSGAAGAGTAGSGGGAAGGGAVTFTRVFEEVLVGTGCGVGACHGNAMVPSKLGLADKTVAFTGLVGVKAAGSAGPGPAAGGCAGQPIDRVKAGDPENSLLVQKLEGKQTCGSEMPIGGMLKPEQIKLVRDWISAGAKND